MFSRSKQGKRRESVDWEDTRCDNVGCLVYISDTKPFVMQRLAGVEHVADGRSDQLTQPQLPPVLNLRVGVYDVYLLALVQTRRAYF